MGLQAGRAVNLKWEFLVGMWGGWPAQVLEASRGFQRLPILCLGWGLGSPF